MSNGNGLSKRSEEGSALIGVLLILFLITVLGAISMRQGLTSLNISTNAQVQALLVQTTDTVLNKVATADVTTITSISGVVGAALANGAPNQEYVFCYRPTSTDNFGLSLNANIIQGKTTAAVDGTSNVTTVDSGGNGFCVFAGTPLRARQSVTFSTPEKLLSVLSLIRPCKQSDSIVEVVLAEKEGRIDVAVTLTRCCVVKP
jgi:hypothetical protein